MTTKDRFDIEEVRKEFSEMLKQMEWHFRTGRWSTHDWLGNSEIGINDGGQGHMVKLCKLLHVDLSDGRLQKKDKRGSWR